MKPFYLIMVMQGRHPENSSPFTKFLLGIFKPANLQNHRKIFQQKNPAQNRNQKLFSYGYRYYRYNSTDGQTPSITHKNLCWISVIPKKTNQCTHKGGDKNGHLSRIGDVHDVEII